MANLVSLTDIIREYTRIRTDRNFGRSWDLKKVRVRIEHDTNEIKSTKSPYTSKFVVQNGQLGPQLKTEKNLKNEVEFEIVQGFCTGLGRLADFKLPRGHGTIQVDLGMEGTQTSSNEIGVVMTSSSQKGKQATVPSEPEVISAFITSKVYPSGNVYFESGTGSLSIQNIIGHLSRENSDTVASFESDGDGYYWVMQSTCLMNVDFMHTHSWSS